MKVEKVIKYSYFLGPPTVTIPQSSYNVIIGSSVTLTCNVTSDLDITSVTWQRTTKNNSELLYIIVYSDVISSVSPKYSGSNSSSPSLTIFNADKQDEGFYICIVTNEYGRGNSSVTLLTVKGRFKEPTIFLQEMFQEFKIQVEKRFCSFGLLSLKTVNNDLVISFSLLKIYDFFDIYKAKFSISSGKILSMKESTE